MGMYTELHFNAQLIRDTPHRITDVLAYMTGTTHSKPAVLPDHALFGTRRWDSMLQCDSSYFPLSPASSIDHEYGHHYLRVRSCFKNYDDEIAAFLDWIMPWVDADTECLGYHRYEEDDHPTLIYKNPPGVAVFARGHAGNRAEIDAAGTTGPDTYADKVDGTKPAASLSGREETP